MLLMIFNAHILKLLEKLLYVNNLMEKLKLIYLSPVELGYTD